MSLIHPVIDNKKVVVSGKVMFVDQMHTSLLPGQTSFITALDKARICLFSSFFASGSDRIMVFGNVKVQEMFCWKILVAIKTSVDMMLLVMDTMFLVGSKPLQLVRR